jgi:hypothetical protein
METQLDACIQLAEKILKRITGSSAAPPLHQELTPLSVISLGADGRFIAADDVETCNAGIFEVQEAADQLRKNGLSLTSSS